MNYGFAVDNRKCIGCHACTVACKAEHETPLGVNRTWVKYVEKGTFPDTRRFFSVLRCNHCESAPCVTICPVSALYDREDGIVDFDPERCIGCKACIQGCPYDAIHIDPGSNTAAKCNYCAHRVEVGLEPPCVVVCPERAIIPGDLEDPDSEISRLTRRQPVQVRKPEKGTLPNVFYIDGEEASLTPAAAPPRGEYLWSQGREPGVSPRQPASATAAGALSDEIWDRVRAVMGEKADRAGRVYDTGQTHQDSWGWKISAYLWTKSVACGTMMLTPFLWGLGGTADYGNVRLSGLVISLVFLTATAALLVADLRRPDRFLWVMTRPQWSSWLTRGSYILFVLGLLVSGMLAARFLGLSWLWSILAWPAVLAAAGGAVYTAFLFWQSKGRDLWQSPLLPFHLLIQALIAGVAALHLARTASGGASPPISVGSLGAGPWLAWLLVASALSVILEVWAIHQTADASSAARWMRTGERGRLLRWGVLGAGHLAPLVLIFLGLPGFLTLAAILSLVGLMAYEQLYVRAGQSVALS